MNHENSNPLTLRQSADVPGMSWPLQGAFESAADGIITLTPDGTVVSWNRAAERLFGCSTRQAIGQSFSRVGGEDSGKEIAGWLDRLRKQEDAVRLKVRRPTGEGARGTLELSGAPILDPAGTAVGAVVIARDLAEGGCRGGGVRCESNAGSRLEKINRCLLELGDDHDVNINRLTALSGELFGAACALYNRLQGKLLCAVGQWQTPPSYQSEDSPEGHICYDVIRGNEDRTIIIRDLPRTPYAETDPNVRAYGLQTYVGCVVRCAGRPVGSLCMVYGQDYRPSEEDQRLLGIVAAVIGNEDTRKQFKEQLKKAQDELLDASRLAGMAEMATSVLHNVGNVLNSVNISASLVSDQLKFSKAANITRVAALMREHASDLGEFLANDPKGRQLIHYLETLGSHLSNEQSALLREMEQIRNYVEHVKDIVAMQQNYARVSGVSERVMVTDLVEDALRMNAGSLLRRDVRIIRDYAPQIPPVTVEKHKVLQILVNLIRNANYACDESGRTDKQLVVRIRKEHDRVRIVLSDNGVGIPSENLSRIFTHGFTTRKNGHGFGLHSSVQAAREMGGRLTAHSDGTGRGASFTLELPVQPVPE